MSLELETPEKIGQGLRRVVTELTGEAISLMERRPSNHAIHETRKNIKKLRAMMRLMRCKLETHFDRENRSLRDAGRCLATAREAYVLRQTVLALGKLSREEDCHDAFRHSRRALMSEVAAQRHSLPLQTPQQVARELEGFLGRVAKWPFGSTHWSDVAAGLGEIYKKGRRAGRLAASAPTGANFHEWRKRVKELWSAIQLLNPGWPAVMTALASELKTLSDRLGDDHDLWVLREKLADPGGETLAKDFSRLREIIDHRRASLEHAALVLGRRLYLEPPRLFIRRLDGYWKTKQ